MPVRMSRLKAGETGRDKPYTSAGTKCGAPICSCIHIGRQKARANGKTKRVGPQRARIKPLRAPTGLFKRNFTHRVDGGLRTPSVFSATSAGALDPDFLAAASRTGHPMGCTICMAALALAANSALHKPSLTISMKYIHGLLYVLEMFVKEVVRFIELSGYYSKCRYLRKGFYSLFLPLINYGEPLQFHAAFQRLWDFK